MSAPTDEFQFKVKTVKWFGLLCAVVTLGMIALGFWYLDRIVHASQSFQPSMSFGHILDQKNVSPDMVAFGLEHDGMGMRDKRGIAALYMRAYSQFLAIVAGTVLSLLGAVFILARVDSAKFDNDLAWGNVKWVLSSSSPGVVLALLGVLLIGGVVYLSSDPIRVFDSPIFLGRGAGSPELLKAMTSPGFEEKMGRDLAPSNQEAKP